MKELASEFETTIEKYAEKGDEIASEILNDMHQFLLYEGDINSLLEIGTPVDYGEPPGGPIPPFRQDGTLGRRCRTPLLSRARAPIHALAAHLHRCERSSL